MNAPRLEELLIAWEENSLTEEALAELKHLLATEPQARRRLVEAGVFQSVAESRVLAWRALEPVGQMPSGGTRRKPSGFGWLSWRPLAAAAVVLFVCGLLWLKPSPAVRLANVKGDVRVWRSQKTVMASSGFVLEAGDWLLTGTDGAVEVQFRDEATKLSIGANAEFGVVAAQPGKELKLTAGTLTASVARQSASHPMLIRTPTAKAEVLGTKFELGADKIRTKLNVTEGRVLIARTDDESGVVVEATQSATVTANAPVSVIAPPPAQSLKNALLAHWKFDGDGDDASGNGNELTLGAGVEFGDGRIGRALDLHAAKVDVQSPRIVFPAVFTIAMWLHLNQGGPARVQPLLGFDGEQVGVDDFWLTLPPTFPGSGIVLDVRGRQMGSRAYSSERVVRAGNWHQVTIIADSLQGRATFYVDGSEATAVAGLRRDFKLAGPLLIGRRVKGGPLPFDGQLDDIRIYGRALSGVEISALAEGK